MKKPNILLISNLFPNQEQPERGVFTYYIARELQRECSLSIVSPLPWAPPLPLLPKRWTACSTVPFHAHFKEFEVSYPKYFMLPFIGDYFSYLSLYFSLSRLINGNFFKEKPDLINVHWAYPDAVAAGILAKNLRIPVVVSLLGSDVNRDMKKSYFARLIKNCLRNCSHVVTVSAALKNAVKVHGISENKISVINNGVDFDEFPLLDKSKSRSDLGLRQDHRYIVFVGRLEPVKGINTLLEAVYKDKKTLAGVKIVLVGDGSLAKKLREDCNNMGLQEYFIFAGHQGHDTVSKWYGAADLFCLPSLNEGHPNVIMEAIASGRPVVASDVGAISEFVTSEVGALFQAGDSKSLGKALQNVLAQTWSPEKIRASIATRTWQNNGQQYMKIFQEILSTER